MMWSQENLDKIKLKISDWDDPVNPKAPLSDIQIAGCLELEKIVAASLYHNHVGVTNKFFSVSPKFF